MGRDGPPSPAPEIAIGVRKQGFSGSFASLSPDLLDFPKERKGSGAPKRVLGSSGFVSSELSPPLKLAPLRSSLQGFEVDQI